MITHSWNSVHNNTVVCVDSYDGGVLKGRFFSPYQEMDSFESLSQFLIKTESVLDQLQSPQSYTEKRTFPTLVPPLDSDAAVRSVRKGLRATFEIQIVFRQNSSWQGVIYWQEQKLEQSFRSVLELIVLMDSALRQIKGGAGK